MSCLYDKTCNKYICRESFNKYPELYSDGADIMPLIEMFVWIGRQIKRLYQKIKNPKSKNKKVIK